jgi:uncharacterized protein (DUF1810 family)
MTLFTRATQKSALFCDVMRKYFDEEYDPLTLARL